jgi:hypothetical protein
MHAFILCGVAAVTGAVSNQGPGQDQRWPTEVEGKSLQAWIKEIPQADRAKSLRAMRNTLRFDPAKAIAAVPVILNELGKHKPANSLDAGFRADVPEVLAALLNAQEPPHQELAVKVVNALRPQLKDPQVFIRQRTLQALAQLAPYLREAAPEIVALVKDTQSWELRQAALCALAQYPLNRAKREEVPPAVGTAVFFALRDPCSQVRLAALHAIDRLGMADLPGSAKEVANRLRSMLSGTPRETDLEVRSRILQILNTPRKK